MGIGAYSVAARGVRVGLRVYEGLMRGRKAAYASGETLVPRGGIWYWVLQCQSLRGRPAVSSFTALHLEDVVGVHHAVDEPSVVVHMG